MESPLAQSRCPLCAALKAEPERAVACRPGDRAQPARGLIVFRSINDAKRSDACGPAQRAQASRPTPRRCPGRSHGRAREYGNTTQQAPSEVLISVASRAGGR